MFDRGGKPRKPTERAAARKLRRDGMPIKRIANRVGVSPTSVFYWTRDIELSPEQRERNLRGPMGPHNPERVARRAAAWRIRSRQKRATYQDEGRRRARQRDALHMAGCMLYWAEGSKDRNQLHFANSDPGMMRFFWRFLRQALDVEPADATVRLNVYTTNGLTLREIEDYWLGELNLPRTCLRGHTVNHTPTSSSGKKRNRLPYGVCSLRILRSTHLSQHIFGAIQEYAGFEEPRWLDGPPRKRRRRAKSASVDQ
jgi:AcrR family transcriptional regulator